MRRAARLGRGGNVEIRGGSSSAGEGGSVILLTGRSDDATSGALVMRTENSGTASGTVDIETGKATGGAMGQAVLGRCRHRNQQRRDDARHCCCRHQWQQWRHGIKTVLVGWRLSLPLATAGATGSITTGAATEMLGWRRSGWCKPVAPVVRTVRRGRHWRRRDHHDRCWHGNQQWRTLATAAQRQRDGRVDSTLWRQ